VLAAALGLYLSGVLLGYDELFVLAVAATLPLAIGGAWVLRPPNLAVRREVEPDRITRGDPAFGALHLSNTAKWTSGGVVAIEPCGPRRITTDVPRLKPGQATTARYKLPTERRAAYHVGPVELTRRDPLGLWERVQRTGESRRVWVHPVVHPLAGLPSGRTRSLEGASSNQLHHGSITFHALREYVVGDDLRLMHWRSFARTRTPMVRENVDTTLPQITLAVDARAAVHTKDGFEEAMEACASVAVAASRAGYPIRLLTTGGRAAGGRGVSADARGLLDLLAELEREPEGDLTMLFARLGRERRSDTLIIVTGAPADEDLRLMGALARRYDDAVVVRVADDDARVPVAMAAAVVRGADAAEAARRWNQQVARR
jgi:uncharacterized protein (DUF58 family)